MKYNTATMHSYTSYRLPVYPYVPGFNIHPGKNTEIKHIPDFPDTAVKFSSKNWHESVRYLYAIDLFNNKYFWEVHEVLEKLWLETGKDSPEGTFFKGLIQLAVALLKKTAGNKRGLIRLTEKAIPKLNTQTGIYLGIDIDAFINQYLLFIDDKISEQPIIHLQFPL